MHKATRNLTRTIQNQMDATRHFSKPGESSRLGLLDQKRGVLVRELAESYDHSVLSWSVAYLVEEPFRGDSGRCSLKHLSLIEADCPRTT